MINSGTIRVLSQVFSEIPFNVWERIVRKEPEWECMEQFLNPFGFGPFSVLMITLGLNDYQLKGKAEEVYWPKIKNFLNNATIPTSCCELKNLLKEFYKHERLHNKKN